MSQNQGRLFTESFDILLDHSRPICKLAKIIPREEIELVYETTSQAQTGQPPLPSRLVAGLFFLKHIFNYSDKALCDMLPDQPYCQYFCGYEAFQARSKLTQVPYLVGENDLEKRGRAVTQDCGYGEH